MNERAWKKLRRRVQSARREWDGEGMSREDKVLAAAFESAYGSVLRMMDSIEKAEKKSTASPA